MSEMSAHERYLRGLPINDELQAVRDGKILDVRLPGDSTPAPPPIENAERELTSHERGLLRELRMHEGWPVYQRLLEKTFQLHQKNAINGSVVDPLGNSAAVVNRWAYLAMYQQARHEAEALMQFETKKAAE